MGRDTAVHGIGFALEPMDVISVSLTDALGWLSSGILVATVGKQVHKQWRDGQSHGVSRWLFIGQIAASLGFTLYSWLVDNWVFVVTNLLMLGNAVVGYGIVMYHRQRHRLLPTPTVRASSQPETPAHTE